jgi:hypothetical protein
MSQEIVITLANDCECTESGECTCTEDYCACVCACVECGTEYVAEVCECGGNCGCER